MPPETNGTARPLHERVSWLGYVRGKARGALFEFLRKLAATDDARAIQVGNLRNLLPRRAALAVPPAEQPYADLGRAASPTGAAHRPDVILITARFRSGSTALWNVFRALPGHTAYYEPFNERRWFDPAARGGHTDPTHRGVTDYWREYDGLTELAHHYREEWTDRSLYMDADSWDPGMKRYVEILIDRAAGRPVLQFNRIDFRLPWFRHHFPRAGLVHLYRHPRDQWCSALVDPAAAPLEMTPDEFARKHDHFYLMRWASDLKYYFPFLGGELAAHPYRLFYLVWKLSYLFGRAHAHHSLAFEDLTAAPQQTLAQLFAALNITGAPLDELARQIEKPRAGRWRDYASEAWFAEQESACEGMIAEFFQGGT